MPPRCGLPFRRGCGYSPDTTTASTSSWLRGGESRYQIVVLIAGVDAIRSSTRMLFAMSRLPRTPMAATNRRDQACQLRRVVHQPALPGDPAVPAQMVMGRANAGSTARMLANRQALSRKVLTACARRSSRKTPSESEQARRWRPDNAHLDLTICAPLTRGPNAKAAPALSDGRRFGWCPWRRAGSASPRCGVVTGHHHLGALRQRHHTGHVGGAEVELRTIVVEERRVPASSLDRM
jgi:hypothetical protein